MHTVIQNDLELTVLEASPFQKSIEDNHSETEQRLNKLVYMLQKKKGVYRIDYVYHLVDVDFNLEHLKHT